LDGLEILHGTKGVDRASDYDRVAVLRGRLRKLRAVAAFVAEACDAVEAELASAGQPPLLSAGPALVCAFSGTRCDDPIGDRSSLGGLALPHGSVRAEVDFNHPDRGDDPDFMMPARFVVGVAVPPPVASLLAEDSVADVPSCPSDP
jgi:hypothetical protein